MNTLLVTALMIAALNLKAQTKDVFIGGPVITFTEKAHDFGDVKQGNKVTHIFRFKNSGTAPLIISNIISSCGCTSPEWTRNPVMPGMPGEIKITYDSEGKQGMDNKSVTIQSNATSAKLSIRVNVLPKK
jgi:hypothetical protein